MATIGRENDLIGEVSKRVSEGMKQARDYLASPEGQELRKRVAQFAIIAAPLLFRVEGVQTS